MTAAFVVTAAPLSPLARVAHSTTKRSRRICTIRAVRRCVPHASDAVFSAGSSRRDDLAGGVMEAVSAAAGTLSRRGVDASIAIVFVHSCTEGNARNEMRRVVDGVRRALASRRVLSASTHVFGCTSGQFSGSQSDAAISVALVHLPDEVTVHVFRIREDSPLDIDAPPRAWHQLVGLHETKEETQLVLLQHPDYERMLDLVAGLDFALPNSPKVGAVAARAQPLHTAYIFDDNGAHDGGVVGLAVSGTAIKLNVMLAQGARGVGPMMEVTEVRNGTEITKAREIGTPTETEGGPMTLFDMWHGTEMISDADYQLARKYLLLGIEVDMLADTLVAEDDARVDGGAVKGKKGSVVSQPDMVVRRVLGFNDVTRSLAVEGARVRLGSRARFQVRDEQCARDELSVLFDRQRLEGVTHAMNGLTLIGAMVLADTERGQYLFGDMDSDMDRRLFQDRFQVPLCSLACNGQISPLPAPGYQRHFPIRGVGVAASTFTHSSAALFLLFYARSEQTDTKSEAKVDIAKE